MKILICDKCSEELKKTNHLDLCSTYRSIIYGCSHSIKDLDEEIRAEKPLPIAPRKDMECIDIIDRPKPIRRINARQY